MRTFKMLNHNAPLRTLTLLLVAVLGVSGCAFSDEGATEYRKSEFMSSAAPAAALPSYNEGRTDRGVAPVSLVKKGLESSNEYAAIRRGDSIAIRLRQGFVKHFFELGINPLRRFQTNGEIAVIVNAFEYSSDDPTKDFDFSPAGIEKGRLVYYSPDVSAGQFLNFDNMPIYGPITYNGNPIGIDIAILEIDDANTEQVKALLSTLASAGAQAFAPAAPVLPLLDDLGGALLSAGRNDIEMRFFLVLDPPSSFRGLAYPRVEAGDYVFLREENRAQDTDWSNLFLDANSGRLYTQESNIPYRDNTYITLQINKGFDSDELDLSQNTFGQFLSRLKEVDSAHAEALEPALDGVQKLIYRRVQLRNFSSARALLTQYLSARAAAAGAKEGTAKAAEEGKAKRAAFDLFRALSVHCESGDETMFAGEHFDLILARIREHVAPETPNLTNLTTRGSFCTQFQDAFDTFYGVLSGGAV